MTDALNSLSIILLAIAISYNTRSLECKRKRIQELEEALMEEVALVGNLEERIIELENK